MDVVLSCCSRESKRDLITLDLLGGCSTDSSSDLHLHLDLRFTSPFRCRTDFQFHPLDLNLTPEDGLKPSPASVPGSQSVCTIEKVKWALERAEREIRGKEIANQRRGRAESGDGSGDGSHSPSSLSSITTASGKRQVEDEEGFDGCDSAGSDGSLLAAGCPSCLSYVLISKANPRCPRCDSKVALPPLPAVETPQKRLQIDLNFELCPL